MEELDRDELRRFSERLRMIIGERGLMQQDVARRAGITPESLSAYCRGKRGPDFRSLMGIARALDVSPALFFCRRLAAMDMRSACWERETEARSNNGKDNENE